MAAFRSTASVSRLAFALLVASLLSPLAAVPGLSPVPRALADGPACDASVADPSLLAHWKFDDAGAPASNAVSGGSSLQLIGNAAFSGDVPAVNFDNAGAIDFDGSTGYGSGSTTLSLTEGGTVSLWFQTANITQDFRFLVTLRYGVSGRVAVIQRGSTLWFFWHDGGTPIVSANNFLTAGDVGAWKHLALVNDHGTLNAYVDGVQLGQGGGAALNVQTTSVIVGGYLFPSNLYNGRLDDLRVYDRALTATEVADLAGGACRDSGAPPLPTTGGNGFHRRRLNLIEQFNNFSNPDHVSAPVAPPSFGGPHLFTGDDRLEWYQLNALCTLHDRLETLNTYDVAEYLAENFAHLYGVSEEFALAIILRGDHCDMVIDARAEAQRLEQLAAARAEEERHAALMALYHPVRPNAVEFAVDEKGYPVSSDAIWNTCIRNVPVYLPGEDKPVNCRRYHEGHTWTHPDTHVAFQWTDRHRREIRVTGSLVTTTIVPEPTPAYAARQVVVRGNKLNVFVLTGGSPAAETDRTVLESLRRNLRATIGNLTLVARNGGAR